MGISKVDHGYTLDTIPARFPGENEDLVLSLHLEGQCDKDMDGTLCVDCPEYPLTLILYADNRVEKGNDVWEVMLAVDATKFTSQLRDILLAHATQSTQGEVSPNGTV